jgi:molybdopterin-guanine dinucleotide biosynthesis protein A
MGQDKSLLDYHGLSHRQYLADLLRPLCADVWVSLNAAQIPLPGERVLADTEPDAGPLGGIRTAFVHGPGTAWLVVACDWPLLTTGTLRELVENRQPAFAATTFRNPVDGSLEPLLTIWEPACVPFLEAAWQRGERSPRRLLGELPTRVLDAPFPDEWLNANTPETYQALRRQVPRP